MNLREARTLDKGDWIHHKTLKNADHKTPMRFKITSIKTWKRRPREILIGLKRGLYEYLKINETELEQFEKGDGY